MISNKRLSKQEMKILVYNKMKSNGLSYREACAEVSRDIEQLKKQKPKEEKKKSFKEKFKELKNENKRI